MTRVNWFMAASALLMLGGGLYEFMPGRNWKLGVVYLAYAVSNAMLAVMK